MRLSCPFLDRMPSLLSHRHIPKWCCHQPPHCSFSRVPSYWMETPFTRTPRPGGYESPHQLDIPPLHILSPGSWGLRPKTSFECMCSSTTPCLGPRLLQWGLFLVMMSLSGDAGQGVSDTRSSHFLSSHPTSCLNTMFNSFINQHKMPGKKGKRQGPSLSTLGVRSFQHPT